MVHKIKIRRRKVPTAKGKTVVSFVSSLSEHGSGHGKLAVLGFSITLRDVRMKIGDDGGKG
jgi:hypothetical protein